MKEKIKGIWNKLNLFGKFSVISLFVLANLTLIAFVAGSVFAGIISIVAIALIVIALLMKKQVIKVSKEWVPMLTIILSLILIVPYFGLFKINVSDFHKYNWNEIVLAEMLPKPASPYGEITSNSTDYLSLTVTKTTAIQYKEYVEACIEKGFTIDAESTGSYFDAYNITGYKLSLSYNEYSGEMYLTLDEETKMENIIWPNSTLATLLPVPKSTQGTIYSNDENYFSVYIGDTSIDEYNAYVKACEDKGFNVNLKKEDKSFSAKNSESNKLTVTYEGNNVIYISISQPEFDIKLEVECEENWIFSKYDINISIDDDFEGTIPHGDKKDFDITLKKGTHTISFENSEDDTLDGEVKVDITKDETIRLKVSCSSFGIETEVLSGTQATDPSNENSTNSTLISLTLGDEDFKGMNYKDAEKKFREMGFTKFKYEPVETEDESIADTICYVDIVELLIGDSKFNKGDKFNSSSTITFFTYKYEKPEAPTPVFYSTNDYETAKKGNTGVFSYVGDFDHYDIYWIIDFNEGYVYYFTDGDGEDFCDRLKIESGDLNTNIKITYHDGGTPWSYKLHFKYENHPETLIMVDQNGFDHKYTTTDLDDALSIRKTKRIKEY